MKPTFLLCGGIGWCATNPLRHTIKDVCNVGLLRESHYLKMLCGRGDKQAMLAHIRKWEGLGNPKQAKPVKDWLRQPVSLDSYITYYKNLYNQTDIPTIGDGSNSNYDLPEDFLQDTISKLKEHFDVRAYMIFRDPVRRAWSHINHQYFGMRYFDVTNKIRRKNKSFEQFLNSELPLCESTRYIQNLEKFQRHIPTLPIVMEELWEGDSDSELELLSSFIGHPVTELYENVYSPDKGIHKDMSNYRLNDQWGSDHLELTPEVYYQIKNILQPTYDAWQNKFGSLPLYWGKPIDYSANV